VSNFYLLITVFCNRSILVVIRKRNNDLLEAEELAEGSQDGTDEPPSKRPRAGSDTSLNGDEAELNIILGAAPPAEDDSGKFFPCT
jgi:hypothetical protein